MIDQEKEKGEPVKVYVRIRPEIRSDGDTGQFNGGSIVIPLDEASLKIMPPDGIYGVRKSVSAMDDKIYSFDKVFTQSATQEEIYDHVADHVLETIRGYNTTIFAYGATGSGKSYTMTGNKLAPGIIPRAIGDLFRHIENTAAAESDAFFYVRLSYVELYNNNFRNLLENVSKDVIQRQSLNSLPGGLFSELDDFDMSSTATINSQMTNSNGNFKIMNGPVTIRGDKIEVRESPSAGVFLAGPNLRIPVTSAQEAFQLIAKGNKYRAVGSTQCNDVSSRSHAILTFHVESKVSISSHSAAGEAASKSELRLGKIHLVDLAGSERLTLSGAEGSTMLETQNINLSLTALGDVLSALSKNAAITQQQQKILSSTAGNKADALDSPRRLPTLVPVPYRNSKLTHLLKDSLGGNSKTIMITNIRTGKDYFQQTDISLMYASRAKKVRNRSLVNRNVIGDTGIHAVTSEIERLKKSLEDRSTEFDKLRLLQMRDAKENSALKNRLQELKEANELEKKQLESQVSTVIHSQAGHIAAQRQKITMLQSALQDELTMSQNRIAEQEKEIKWLKQALDESVQVSLTQPQIQSQVETLQSQAKQSQSELDKVLKHAEELKALNSTLTGKLNESESARRLLQVDCESVKRDKAALQSQLGKETQLRTDRDRQLLKLAEQTKEAESLLHQKDQLIRQKDVQNLSLESQLKEVTEKNRGLESDRFTSKHRYLALKEKLAELEADKLKLTERLESSVQSLEASMADKVRITQKQLHEAAEKILQLQEENRKLDQRHLQKDASMKNTSDELSKKMSEYQKEVSELSQKLQSSTNHHKLELEELSTRLRSSEESSARLKSQETELKSVVSKLMLAVQQAEMKAEQKIKQEKALLLSEFEKLMAEKLLHQKKEVDELKINHAKIVADMTAKHGQDMRRQEDRIAEDEAKYQNHLRAAQTKAEQMIDDEIRKGVETLERQHQKALQEVRESMLRERQSDLDSLKADLERNSSKELHQLRLQLELEKEELLRTERDNRLKEQELLKVRFAESKVSIEKDFKLEKDSLTSKLNNDIGSLKQKIADCAQKESSFVDRIKNLEKEGQDNKVKLDRAKRDALDAVAAVKSDYEEKLKSLSLESSQRQQVIETKAAANLAARDQEWDAIMQAKETELTKTRHSLQKREHEMEQQRLLFEMSGDKQSKEIRETTEAMRTQLFDQFEERIRNLQTEHRESVVRALESQEKQLKSRYDGDIQILKSKLTQENVKAVSDIQTKHTLEMEKSMEEHRHAAAEEMRELRKSLELAMQRVLADKDDALAHEQQMHQSSINALEEQLLRAQHELKQQQQLRQSLAKEVDQLQQLNIDQASQHRLEVQSALAEMQRVEASHQEYIGSLFKEHQEEIIKQRKALELSHSKVINNLNDELAQVNERYNYAITESAIKHSQESSKAVMDQQVRFEELKNRLVRQVEEKDRVLEELKESYRLELISKEEEMERKSVRLVTDLKERFSRELDDARHSYEESLSNQLRLLSANHSKEVEEVTSEQYQLLQASDLQIVQLKDSLKAASMQIQNLQSRLQSESDDAVSKISEVNEQNKRTIEDLKNQQKIQSLQLISEFEDMKAKLENEHQIRLDCSKDEILKTVLAHEAEVDLLKRQMNEKFEEQSRVEARIKQQHADLLREFDATRAELDAEKQKANDTKSILSETSTTLSGQLEELRRFHAEDIGILKSKNASELSKLSDSLHETHAAELKVLQETFAVQIEKKELEFEESQQLSHQEHARIVSNFNNVLSDTQNNFDQLKIQYQQLSASIEEKKRNFDSEVDILASRHLEEVARLNEIHANEKDDLLNQLRRVHVKELDGLRLAFEEERLSFQQQLRGLNEEVVERTHKVEMHHSEHVKSLNDTLVAERKKTQELLESHKKELLVIESTVTKDLQTQHDRLLEDKDHLWRQSMVEKDSEVSRLKNILESTVGEHAILAESATRERDKLISELDRERRNFENEKNDMIQQHKEIIHALNSSMTESNQRSILQIQASHEAQFAEANRRKDEEFRILKEHFDLKINEIQCELQRSIDQASIGLSQKQELIAHLEYRASGYQERIQTLEAKIAASESARQSTLNEVDILQKESKREIGRLMNDIEESSKRHTELCDVYVQKITVLEKRLEQQSISSNSLQEASTKRESELEKQLSWLQSQLQSLEESKANEIDVLKRQLGKAIADRDVELGRLRESFTDELSEQEDGLVEQYESAMSALQETLKQDHWKQMDELRTRYRKDVDQMNHDSTERNEVLQKRLGSLQEKVAEAEVVVKELNRQLAKANAQRETAQQDTLTIQLERDSLLDRINNLEIESAETSSKAKFSAQQQLLQERNRLEALHKQKVSELQAELVEKSESESAKATQLIDMEKQLAASQVAVKAMEEDLRLFKSLAAEREAVHDSDMKKTLEDQKEELQSGYLKLIQDQVQSLTKLVQAQNENHSSAKSEELNAKFLGLVKELPSIWQQKHVADLSAIIFEPPVAVTTGVGADSIHPSTSTSMGSTQEKFSNEENAVSTVSSVHRHLPRTPLHLLANQSTISSNPAEIAGRYGMRPEDPNSDVENSPNGHRMDSSRQFGFGRPKNIRSKSALPWSSPSLRSSPTDQLIAAILDGDVQGVRSVIRSNGDDLRAPFWRDIVKSVLPLHRAVSGLHFHGNDRLLISTIEALSALGADVNATDHAGNTVLHKAIQVCTSKNVAAIVSTLLSKGANAKAKNKDGDTPLHSECLRVRSASAEVISSLVTAGADVNSKNIYNSALTPLSLVLLRGTAVSIEVWGAERNEMLSPEGSAVTSDSRYSNRSGDKKDSQKTALNRRVWLKTVAVLIRHGCTWDPLWRSSTGSSQLHLVVSAFPPHREDVAVYKQVIQASLEHSSLVEDSSGRSAAFVLVERMASTPLIACSEQECALLLHMMLRWLRRDEKAGPEGSVGNKSRLSADRSGRTVLDIEELVPHSCLSTIRPLLVEYCNTGGDHDSIGHRTSTADGRGWVLDNSSSSHVQARINRTAASYSGSARSSQYRQLMSDY